MSYLFNCFLFENNRFDPAMMKRCLVWHRRGYDASNNIEYPHKLEEFRLVPVNERISAIFYHIDGGSRSSSFSKAYEELHHNQLMGLINLTCESDGEDYSFCVFSYDNMSGPLKMCIHFENGDCEARKLYGKQTWEYLSKGGKIEYDNERWIRFDDKPYLNENGHLVKETEYFAALKELEKPFDGLVMVEELLGIGITEITAALHKAWDSEEYLLYRHQPEA